MRLMVIKILCLVLGVFVVAGLIGLRSLIRRRKRLKSLIELNRSLQRQLRRGNLSVRQLPGFDPLNPPASFGEGAGDC